MLKPLHKNVVLKKVEEEKKTASGIILTQAPEKKPSLGEVVAVGEECDKNLTVYSKVVNKEYTGTTVKVDDVEYIICEEKDILAVVE